MTNLYDILDLPPTATDEDIKKAYKEKAKNTHPDKQNGDKDKFQEVALAYSVLSDVDKRQHYDNTGQTTQPVFDTKFMGYVNGIIGQLINSNVPITEINMVSYIENTIHMGISQMQRNIESNEHQLKRVVGMRKRLKMKGQGDNILDRVFQQNEVGFLNAIGAAKSEIEFLTLCLDRVGGYEYEI